jgi:signal transduction histidine kinase
VIDINERAVETAGRQIEELQRRSDLRDALALICVLAGTVLGLGGARRYFLAAKLRSRLDAERAAELDIFAGRVAHDLRSPLQAIQMRAWLGARAPTPEGAQSALGHIDEQTQRMKGIIDALLAFARAAAHPDPSSRSDVTAVVAEVVTEAQLPAAEAQIELVVEPLPAATVACDPSVLAVILSNLVRNAIKYVGGGSEGVRRITLRERFQDRSLLLEVEDTGPGLPPGAEVRVFDPFVRGAELRAPDGIGLGLATVKRLVEANRGKVGVESHPGHGCCFWFTLPLAA